MESLYVGVDVGTGSVRAALVSEKGKVLKVCTREIKLWSGDNYFEQSSDDIWNACCYAVKNIVQGVPLTQVKGLGMDATCSLVVLDKEGQPLSVSVSGNNEKNVILWLDHRAAEEAQFINSQKSSVLKYVGGKISLEMEIPKLLWLKNNLKTTWDAAGYFFDLPDFLTWKATGSEVRSLCSLVCKWTYEVGLDGHIGWNKKFFKDIGLSELMENNCEKIGFQVNAPGTPCGNGLTEQSAFELGLLPRTCVGTSIIDAHAGGLGMIGCHVEGVSTGFHTRLGLICGTSTCHMIVNKSPLFVQGVWGPYYSAMVPGFWLNEGGQSATGKLIDHIIDSHPATQKIKNKIANRHIHEYLNDLLQEMTMNENLSSMALLTKNIHVWPDFHGNRSPLADPSLRGMVSGLSLSTDEQNLALLYLAAIQALSYGTLHILKVLEAAGHSNIQSILICGGLSRNPLFIQTQADVVGLPVLCPNEKESVLLGAAILGAYASGAYVSVQEATELMGGGATVLLPRLEENRYHAKKFQVFMKMVDDQVSYQNIMS